MVMKQVDKRLVLAVSIGLNSCSLSRPYSELWAVRDILQIFMEMHLFLVLEQVPFALLVRNC